MGDFGRLVTRWIYDRRMGLAFYLGLPIIVGFLLGTNRAGIGAAFPWSISVLFWVSCTVGAWAFFHYGTVLAAEILKALEPPLIAKLALGVAIASIPARIFINNYAALFEPFMIDGSTVQSLPPTRFSADFLISYFQRWSGVFLLWITANIFFDKVAGFSRYRPAPRFDAAQDGRTGRGAEHVRFEIDTDTDDAGLSEDVAPVIEDRSVSMLLSRLPRPLGLRIRALKSEDHYLRVYTDRGDALLLYNLGTAIDELETLGFRGLKVHRSYWVRQKAVQRAVRDGRRLFLELDIGIRVPVSQTYRETVKAAGLIDN